MGSGGSEIIIDVVRGAKPIALLASAGIVITTTQDACDIYNTGDSAATATPQDIALGLAAYRHDPVAAREWARIVLAGSVFLDLDFNDDPEHDELLGILWDMSFGESIDDQQWELVGRVIAHGDQSHHP